jgi:hypothetical protein
MSSVHEIAAVLVMSSVLLLPSFAWSQSSTTGAIAGVVKDTTGAVLPGVTVEAASPALIEKVRTVVSDDKGEYKIVDLRPGSYAVTFTLSGLSTFKRDGIELTAGFTAAVNGEMKVGALQETITVSGASPVIDVQNVRTQQTLSQELLNAVPTAKSYVGMTALTLGASGGGAYTGTSGNRDVGGNNGEGVTSMSIHGSRTDGAYSIEGMRANSLTGAGYNRRFMTNSDAVQEIVAETGSQSSETETGGVSVNVITREGGNSFRGLLEGEYTGKGLQNTNVTDALRARGIRAGNKEEYIYSSGGGVGGPIKRDRVWFFTSFRAWGTKEDQAGIYFNQPQLQHTLVYQPDLSHPGYTDSWIRDSTSRLTWQVAPKHKVSAIVTIQKLCACRNGLSTTRAPENTTDPVIGPGLLSQVNWSHPQTNKLLFEAGFAVRLGRVNNGAQPEVSVNDIGVLELSTGINYGPQLSAPGAAGPYGNIGLSKQYNTMFATSYVTGSHAFKVGVQTITGQNPNNGSVLNNSFPIQYQLRNGIPVSLLEVASPANYFTNVKLNMGIFAQDQWTMNRLTLNLGLRVDYLNAYSPAVTRPAGYFLPQLNFAAAENLPNWKDINPRLGAAYDLFGNGRTAIKGLVGRYVLSEATTIAQARNPQGALAVTTTRTWNDANGNFVPDCNLQNNAANGECGATSNSTFGTTVFNTNYDTAFTNGFDVRTYNWQANASVQQELAKGVALTVGYFRTWYGNLTVSENVAVTAADFTTYCITAPADSRLPGGGGNRICGLYDINPEKFGLVNNLTHVDSGRSEYFNGLDVAVRARFGNGGLLNAGVSSGSTHLNNLGNATVHNCSADAATNTYYGNTPQQRLFCVTDNRQDQVKVNASYPLWWGVQAAAVYQNIPGANQTADLVLTNAQVAPALGRSLGACRGAATCTATVTVPVISPNSQREHRGSQLDVRLSRRFNLGGTSIRPGFDIYNLLNSNDVLSSTAIYGASWLKPGAILPARLYKFNVLVNF